MDPIVSPGVVAGHTHTVNGGSNFSPSSTFADMRASDCTSCLVKQDMSAYWTPQLYFQYANGSFRSVEQTGGGLVYYLPRNHSSDTTKVQAFPDGLRILTGQMTKRSYNSSSLMAQAIGWNCLGSAGLDGETRIPTLPEYNCPDGLRGEIRFPSCWNGQDVDSSDHFSHMAYSDGESGPCPATHPVRIVTLFYEVMWSIDPLNDIRSEALNPDQPFVLAMGDATGLGYHGDFFDGWDKTVLQDAIDTCTSASGVIEECAVFDLYDTSATCHKTPDVDEIVISPSSTDIVILDSLPGCNPVTSGPADASVLHCGTTPALFSSPVAYTGAIAPPGSEVLSNVAKVVESSSSWTHEGCYSDSGSPRVLTHGLTNSNKTVEGALAACAAGGYTLCGIEYGGETWGANTLDSSSTVLTYDKCYMVCGGDQLQYCGGPSAIDLYITNATATATSSVLTTAKTATTATLLSTATTVNSAVVSTVAVPTAVYTSTAPVPTGASVVQSYGDWTHTACYSDSGNPRTLVNGVTNSKNTVEGGLAACQAKGYKYCGLEYGGETWGANEIYSSATVIAASKCNMKCNGLSTELCGGSSALDLYTFSGATTEVVASAGGYTHQGCYYDSASPRALVTGITNSNSTIEGAIAGCKAKGFTLCGVEYGGETWGANALSSGSYKIDDSKCSMACTSNKLQQCGGNNALDLYAVTGTTVTKRHINLPFGRAHADQ